MKGGPTPLESEQLVKLRPLSDDAVEKYELHQLKFVDNVSVKLMALREHLLLNMVDKSPLNNVKHFYY